MYESTVHLRPTHPLEVSLLHPKSKGVFRLRVGLLSLASKDTPRTGPSFWRNGSLHRSRRWHCPQGVLPARGESGIFALADDRPVALVLLGDSWVPQNVVGAPPIHFGKEDGVERTLLRVACQSEPFLASPWQGDVILHTSVAHWLPK